MHSIDALKNVPIVGEQNNNIQRISRKIAKVYNKSYVLENMDFDTTLGFKFNFSQIKEIANKRTYFNEKEKVIVIEYKKNTKFVVPSIYISNRAKKKYFSNKPDILNENILNENISKEKITKGRILEDTSDEVFDVTSIGNLQEAFSLDENSEALNLLNEGIASWFKEKLKDRKDKSQQKKAVAEKQRKQQKERDDSEIADLAGVHASGKVKAKKALKPETNQSNQSAEKPKYISDDKEVDYERLTNDYIIEFSKYFTTKTSSSESKKMKSKEEISRLLALATSPNGSDSFNELLSNYLDTGNTKSVKECCEIIWDVVSGEALGMSQTGQDVARAIGENLHKEQTWAAFTPLTSSDKEVFSELLQGFVERIKKPYMSQEHLESMREETKEYAKLFPAEFLAFKKAKNKVIKRYRKNLKAEFKGSFFKKIKSAFKYVWDVCRKMFNWKMWIGYNIAGLANDLPLVKVFTVLASGLRSVFSWFVTKFIIIIQKLMGHKVDITFDTFFSASMPHHALRKYFVVKDGKLVQNIKLPAEQKTACEELIAKMQREELERWFSEPEINFLENVVGKSNDMTWDQEYKLLSSLQDSGDIIDNYKAFTTEYGIKNRGDITKSHEFWDYGALQEKMEKEILDGVQSYERIKSWADTFFEFENYGEIFNETLHSTLSFESGSFYASVTAIVAFFIFRGSVINFFVTTWELTLGQLYKALKAIFGQASWLAKFEKDLNISRFIGIKNLATHIRYLKTIDKSVTSEKLISDILSEKDFGLDAKLQKMTSCLMMKNASELMIDRFKKSVSYEKDNDEHKNVALRLENFGKMFDRFLASKLNEDSSQYEEAINNQSVEGENINSIINSQINSVRNVFDDVASAIDSSAANDDVDDDDDV